MTAHFFYDTFRKVKYTVINDLPCHGFFKELLMIGVMGRVMVSLFEGCFC